MCLTRSLPSQVCGTLRPSLEQHELWVPGPRVGSVFSFRLRGKPDLGGGIGPGALTLFRRAERTSGTDPLGLILFVSEKEKATLSPIAVQKEP